MSSQASAGRTWTRAVEAPLVSACLRRPGKPTQRRRVRSSGTFGAATRDRYSGEAYTRMEKDASGRAMSAESFRRRAEMRNALKTMLTEMPDVRRRMTIDVDPLNVL